MLPIHPFPARMAPEIALRHLKRNRPLRVLDPMVGSGTVPRIAQQLGHEAVGFDTDPLALLIAEAWCSPVSPSKLREHASAVLTRVSDWQDIPAKDAYPIGADHETKAFIRYWFDLDARRQLCAIVREINKVRVKPIRLHLLTAVSRCIVVKEKGVSLARDVAHSRPHRAYRRAPIRPLEGFRKATERIAKVLDNQAVARGSASIRNGDARALPILDDSIDLVITSPPYLNAIDYIRAHKFTLVWLGFKISGLRAVRASNVGAERKTVPPNEPDSRVLKSICKRSVLSSRNQNIVLRYVQDLRKLMSEMWRVLRPGGSCVIVVADSNLQRTFVRTSKAIRQIGTDVGFKVNRDYRRHIPASRRYLPPPSSASAGQQLRLRMKTEVVVVLSKKLLGRPKGRHHNVQSHCA
jgi:DNA modification methylase